MKAILFIAAFVTSVSYAQAQYVNDSIAKEPENTSVLLQYLEFQFNAGVSVAGPVKDFRNGTITDQMLQLEWEGLGIEFYSFNFIYKNIGLNLYFQTTVLPPVYNYQNKFESQIKERFENEYFVNFYSTADCNCGGDFLELSSVFIGLNYRIKKGKFEFYPGLSVGSRSFIVNSFQSRFKKRNSNDILEYSLLANSYELSPHGTRGVVVFSPNIRVAYRFHRAFLAFIKPEYMYFNSDISFDEKEMDLYTGTVNSRSYDYNHQFQFYNITIGLTFELSNY